MARWGYGTWIRAARCFQSANRAGGSPAWLDESGYRLAAGDTGGALWTWDVRPLPSTTGLVLDVPKAPPLANPMTRFLITVFYNNGRINWLMALFCTYLVYGLVRRGLRKMSMILRARRGESKRPRTED